MRKATAARGLRGGPEPGTRRAAAVLAGCLLGALALTAAACGSGTTTAGGGTTSSTPAAGGGTGTTAATAVDTTVSSSLGTILVDSKGDTLYRLSKDSTDKSVCDAACAQIWPPLLVTGGGVPAAGSGVTGLGTISTASGEQVTYHGMPLYTFTGDTQPGQVHGQNVTDNWGTWFVVVTKAPAGGGATTTTAASGGGPAF